MAVTSWASGTRLPAIIIIFLAAAPLLGLPAPAAAHGVNVFAYVEDGQVVAEAYFADGRKCQDCTIEVLDPDKQTLLKGKTDTEGKFSFQPQPNTDLLVRLTASMGHQAEYLVPASDLPAAADLPPATKPKEEKPQKQQREEETPAVSQSEAVPPDIEQMVERAVERQIVPLRRGLEEERNRRRFSDIVGGMGYIIGVMGLIAYFLARRQNRK